MNNCHKHACHFSDSELHEYQVPRSFLTLYWIQFFNLATESDTTITSVRSNHLTLCRNFLKKYNWASSSSTLSYIRVEKAVPQTLGFSNSYFLSFFVFHFFSVVQNIAKKISFVIQFFSPLVNISSHHLLVAIASCFALLFTTFGKYFVFLFTIPHWIGTWSGDRGCGVLGRST